MKSVPAASPDTYVTALTGWRELEPRLRPGGKYEMATLELRDGDSITKAAVRRLAARAVELNQQLGDPTHDARPTAKTRRRPRDV